MRRATDIAVTLLVAILLAPVGVAVVLGIWCTSGSPALFRQPRWGRNGRIFVIWKFRTMRSPAFPGEPDDARIDRFGGFLRRTSLDELPQLWNILRGDMTLVGPRPLPVQENDLADAVPAHWARLAVRPGLTGWAQVNGRNSLTFPEKFEQDLWYISHRTVRLDLRIIALTFLQLVRPSGIYGYGVANPGFSEQGEAPEDVSTRTTFSGITGLPATSPGAVGSALGNRDTLMRHETHEVSR